MNEATNATTVNIPKDMKTKVKVAAAQRDLSIQDFVREALSVACEEGGKQKSDMSSGHVTNPKRAKIASLAERAAELAEGLRRIANEESGDAGGDPDRVIEELEQATEVEELKVKAARPARKSPAADREGVTK